MHLHELQFVEPDASHSLESISYLQEYAAAGETWGQWLLKEVQEDYEACVRRLLSWRTGQGSPPDGVPTSVFLLMRGCRILGECSLRHRLTDALRDDGGHISYAVRPTERGKGYGTYILSRVLEQARLLGLRDVLLTCDRTNTASVRVIQKNGGVLTSEGISRPRGRVILRYQIAL
ncbi:MAG: GNAT family N-acetyltransferase [Phycisphaeraceae bacterium]|nr:GNAT family N-acetyltransferase [Phycisphaeraceae bacterium]